MKIRIFQPIVPEYRVALFEGLAERYGDNIEVWAADRIGVDVSCPLAKMRFDYQHSFRKIGPFVWQKGLTLKGLEKGDVIVVCGDLHQLSSLWIAFKAKCKGIKVVWWGHHVSAQAKESKVKIRLRIAKLLSDVYLCYTDAGIDYLEKRGFAKGSVFATGNTIDLDAVSCAKKEWDGVRKFGEKKTLLFCGVLREKVKADVLLKALKLLKEKRNDFHCVIIGGGPMEQEWKKMAHDIGVSSCLTWCGEIRGQRLLAPWFLSADLFVYPGRIGLSIIHSFAFGLPVVLNDNKFDHGPEYTAFQPGVNGWSFKDGDVEDFANTSNKALDGGELKTRGNAGQLFVFENYSMKKMIDRYSEAVEAAHIKE
jgi:glycosyltransferase involved in cell wall biosynthesis